MVLNMIKDKNFQTYSTSDVVNYYQCLQQLQPAEETLIKLLRNQLSNMKMLDLGVGGGRTTKHFFPLVKDYIGVDYSSSMIEACQQRFSPYYPSIKLTVGDARKLSQFADNSFVSFFTPTVKVIFSIFKGFDCFHAVCCVFDLSPMYCWNNKNFSVFIQIYIKTFFVTYQCLF